MFDEAAMTVVAAEKKLERPSILGREEDPRSSSSLDPDSDEFSITLEKVGTQTGEWTESKCYLPKISFTVTKL